MKTVTQLRDEIKNLMKTLEDMRTRCLQEGRDPSQEEVEMSINVMNKVDQLQALIGMELRREATIESLNRPQEQPFRSDPASPGGSGLAKRPQDKFMSFGEQMAAVMRAGMPNGPTDPRLQTPMRAAASGLQEAIPSDGGFLVAPEFSNELLKRTYETGQVSSRCRRIPISSNILKINAIDETSRVAGSRWGGIQAYWEGEADKYTGKKPKFRKIELSLKKLTGLCYATDEMLQDAVALGSLLEQGFTEEFGFQMDDACIWGTGAGVPLGIMNGPCLVTVNKEAGQVAKTVVFENIVNMFARCWAKSRPSAIWFINQDVEPQLYGMGIVVGTGGTPAYMPPGGLSGQPYGTLFGRPVVAIEQCQTLGTLGDIILGDFGEYLIVDKGAMESASSIHVRFEYGEQVFRFTYRADGMPVWNSALTPYKGSNTLSPFVTLQAR